MNVIQFDHHGFCCNYGFGDLFGGGVVKITSGLSGVFDGGGTYTSFQA